MYPGSQHGSSHRATAWSVDRSPVQVFGCDCQFMEPIYVSYMAEDAPPRIPPRAPTARKKSWILYGCGGLLALMLIIIGTVAITLWWIQRPIKPVVLSPQEKAIVENKLDRISASSPARPLSSSEPDRPYTPGAKVIKVTEREINGLLNSNTELGNSVRLEFAKGAINAYLAVPIPKDFPIGGGKIFRARGRFSLSIGNGGEPYAILEDVTVFGISLPKAWLGGLKGENLLTQATGQRNGGPVLRGIKSVSVEPGALTFQLQD